MGTHWTLAGKEVPITGSDTVRWIDLSVSSSSNVAVEGGAAISEDRAACSVIGDPPTYLIWFTPSPSPISSAALRKFHHFNISLTALIFEQENSQGTASNFGTARAHC